MRVKKNVLIISILKWLLSLCALEKVNNVCVGIGADSAGSGGTGEAALSGGRERQPAQAEGHTGES